MGKIRSMIDDEARRFIAAQHIFSWHQRRWMRLVT